MLTEHTKEMVQKKLNDGKLMEVASQSDRERDQFTRVGGGKNLKGKKQKKVEYEDILNFDVGVIQKFGLIQVSPPMAIEELDKKVNEINGRNDWYIENGKAKLQDQIKELEQKVIEESKIVVDEDKDKEE